MTRPTILDTFATIGRAQGTELGPRWRATLALFYGLPLTGDDVDALVASTKRSVDGIRSLTGHVFGELWCRVGRRGLKSTTAAGIAVHEAAFGGHEDYLLPGERGLIAVISKDTAGSEVVARFAELHAQALGLATRWTSQGAIRILEIEGLPFGIACFACNTTAPRGFAMPVVIADEIALWSSDKLGANPDVEVLAAVKPAMAQFRAPKFVAISSPFGVTGVHFETIEANLGDGSSPDVLAVQGPTWDWNESITEEQTRKLERDAVRHAREYGAIPAETESSAFELADVEIAFTLEQKGRERVGRAFVLTDASSLRGDAFTWAVGHELDDGSIVIKSIDAFEGPSLRDLDMGEVVDAVTTSAKRAGARRIFGDQREAAALQSLFRRNGYMFKDYAWSSSSKDRAVQLLRRMLRERKLILPPHDDLRREMIELQARLQPSGLIQYATNGRDYVALLLTLAHAIEGGALKSAVLPSHLQEHVDNLRKVAANPQRAANRMAFMMGQPPRQVTRDRSTMFCRACGYNPAMCRC
jgi:hypothetical protein